MGFLKGSHLAALQLPCLILLAFLSELTTGVSAVSSFQSVSLNNDVAKIPVNNATEPGTMRNASSIVALNSVTTFPPATDPRLYLMPDAQFVGFGATRQGENSQYFSGSAWQMNQYASSAAVVKTIQATVGICLFCGGGGGLLGLRWDLLFTDGTRQNGGTYQFDDNSPFYPGLKPKIVSYTFTDGEKITQVYYDTDPVITPSYYEDATDAHYMYGISFQTDRNPGKDAFYVESPLGATRTIRSSYTFTNLGDNAILVGLEGWSVYATRNPYVDDQAQYLQYPTTVTFQFVNPQVGATLTNTDLPQLNSLPPPGKQYVTHITVNNTNGLNSGGSQAAYTQMVANSYAFTDASTTTNKVTVKAGVKGKIAAVEVSFETAYEWSEADTQSSTTTTTDTRSITGTFTVPAGAVPAGECRVYYYYQTSGTITATPYTGTLEIVVQSPNLPNDEPGVFNIPDAGSYSTQILGTDIYTDVHYCDEQNLPSSPSASVPLVINDAFIPTYTAPNGVRKKVNATYNPCGVTVFRFDEGTTVLQVSQLGFVTLDDLLTANPDLCPQSKIGRDGIKVPTCNAPNGPGTSTNPTGITAAPSRTTAAPPVSSSPPRTTSPVTPPVTVPVVPNKIQNVVNSIADINKGVKDVLGFPLSAGVPAPAPARG